MNKEEKTKIEEEMLLNKTKAQTINLYIEKLEEIERLNNIIASLSIWLNNQYSLYLGDIDDIADTYDVVKNKLDELKGSDKDGIMDKNSR